MKIRRLARAKNCAVFRDYTWPTALPELEARVLIYGWNENDEGGWLTPTLNEGSARLDALRRVLK